MRFLHKMSFVIFDDIGSLCVVKIALFALYNTGAQALSN